MRKVAVMRTIHALPGKREQYLDYVKQADEVRRKWGMVDSLVLEKAVDPTVLVDPYRATTFTSRPGT